MLNPADFRPRLIAGKRRSSPEYRSWQMMKNRCLNPKADDYAFYGGWGITVCHEWLSFDNFLRDMGARPDAAMTLERKDCDDNYCPGNCHWVSRQAQARNRRFIKRYDGKTTWEWAETLGIKPMTFHHRLWRFNKGLISEAQLFRSCK